MRDDTRRTNRRILLIDDSPAIHADFRKILERETEEPERLDDLRAAFLGAERAPAEELPTFELDSAHQGEEGLEMLCAALGEGRPYALAFVDVRMPPGWDGIETIERLWREDPALQVVVCTAYSDHSWEETFERLGSSDAFLILKKPFDPVEISQLAVALTEKWSAEQRVRELVQNLREKEQEARAYATSLETVNRALETAKAAAEKASEMKTEFLVHLSNEIAGKVHGMLGDVDKLLAPDELRDEAMVIVDSILHSSRYLLSALDGVTDMALIDSGRLDLDEEEFPPLEPVESIVAELGPVADAKGLSMRVEHRGVLPIAIRTDRLRLRQILHNLVDNAVRYTDLGSITLTVTSESTDHWDGCLLRYAVADTGRGIPRERQGALFEPFQRVNGVEPGHTPGSGLGLACSKRLAHLLGGDIRVSSEPGTGSRFELFLAIGREGVVERSDSSYRADG